MSTPPDRLHELVQDFWRLIDIVETSDSGRVFHPTKLEIQSCRAIDGYRLGQIVDEMRSIVGAKPRISEAEIDDMNEMRFSNDED